MSMLRDVLGCSAVLLAATAAPLAAASQLTVPMHKVTADGIGDEIGTILVTETASGVSFKVNVSGITAGNHGFHVHEVGNCAPAMKDGKATAANAAGPHFDPDQKKSHRGPSGEGHKGDLPFLTATDKGINSVVNASHLKVADVAGRALMIHEGPDNYSDTPENGGGAARIACGVAPSK